jgi:hypothetical protein
MTQTLQRLVQAAETFHSSASSVAGGSTVWGGSVMGDALSQEQHSRIEEWISEPIEEESAGDHLSESTRLTSPLGESSISGPSFSTNPTTVSDSDSDLERDMIQKFEELAMAKLYQRDYEKAEIFFRRIIERNQEDGKSVKGMSSIKIMIAYTCCFQGRWDEAEAAAIPLTTGKERPSIDAFDLFHTLALRNLRQNQFEQAAIWCKRALFGKKKLLGKDSTSYYQSMGLLARIYDIQGDAIEAEACRSFIPPNTIVENDPLMHLFAAKFPISHNARAKTGSIPPQLSPRRPSCSLAFVERKHPQAKSQARLVICVDFGVTFSGVAYCFESDDGKRDSVKVKTEWPHGSHSQRIPSELYYDQAQKVVSWGSDSSDFLSLDGYVKPGYHKTVWFKARMSFDKSSFINGLNLGDLPPGKSKLDITADFLRQVRMAVQSGLKHRLEQISNQIEWCFTTPTYGNKNTVADLRSAVLQAGYTQDENDDNVTFIADLEAALFEAVETGLVSVPQRSVVLCVALGGSIVSLMAYEVLNKKPLQLRQFTSSTADLNG